jgi:serine protease AprX
MSKKALRCWVLLLVFHPFVYSSSAAAQTAPGPTILSKLDPPLLNRLSMPFERSRVIVRARDSQSMAAIALLISQLGGTLGIELPILTARAADVPTVSLPTLAQNPNVQRIAFDRATVGTVERTGITVGATAVRQRLGYDGSGIGVAVIDSGVTSWHDDLGEGDIPNTQRVQAFVDFVNGHTMPYDDYGHGTHVAGIIAGNGYDSGGARSGMAPATRVIALKVLNGSGQGRISDLIAAFDYVVNHKDLLQIRVVNLSAGAMVYESYESDFLTLAAKRVVEQGVVVVASAGNAGKNAQDGTQYGAILAPGNAPWVLTVGASSHMGTVNRSDDTVAAFSSRGPSARDYAAKPDLVAPGVGIYSLSDPNSALFGSRSAYLLDGTVATTYLPYLSLSGTSQAAPVVAGAVALMLQANPSLTPNAVKAILQYTARVYSGYSALEQGAGFLNAEGAVELARLFASAPASLYSLPPEWSGQIIWGNHRVRRGLLQPGATAWQTGVTWGSATTPDGRTISWGVICSTLDCRGLGAVWRSWGTTCLDAACQAVVWGEVGSQNVVWGLTCGGTDCPARNWSVGDDEPVQSTHSNEEDTVVWGSTEDDTVVWGSTEDDTVVWGSTDAAEPVIWD